MMPRYIFGYIQSKERYTHSKELVDVAGIPLAQVPFDVIVQDWKSIGPGGQWVLWGARPSR